MQKGASKDTFDRFDTFLMRQSLQAEPFFRWCAHVGCGSGQVVEGGDVNQIMRCGACDKRTCFEHRCEWHEGRSCAQYEEDAAKSDEVQLNQRRPVTALAIH